MMWPGIEPRIFASEFTGRMPHIGVFSGKTFQKDKFEMQTTLNYSIFFPKIWQTIASKGLYR